MTKSECKWEPVRFLRILYTQVRNSYAPAMPLTLAVVEIKGLFTLKHIDSIAVVYLSLHEQFLFYMLVEPSMT